jgi:hypothetical protein
LTDEHVTAQVAGLAIDLFALLDMLAPANVCEVLVTLGGE